MPFTYPTSNGPHTVTGEDWKAQQREAGANVVSASRPKEDAVVPEGKFRVPEKVWGPPDSNGTSHLLHRKGALIDRTEAEALGLVETEVTVKVQVEKPQAPKRTQRKPASKKKAATKKPSTPPVVSSQDAGEQKD